MTRSDIRAIAIALFAEHPRHPEWSSLAITTWRRTVWHVEQVVKKSQGFNQEEWECIIQYGRKD